MAEAVAILTSLEGKQLNEAVKRIALLVQGGDPVEWRRLYKSTDCLDRAIFFVERLAKGDAFYLDALRRNQKLCQSFQRWKAKANRILAKERWPAQRKLDEKIATEKKLKALRRQSKTA